MAMYTYIDSEVKHAFDEDRSRALGFTLGKVAVLGGGLVCLLAVFSPRDVLFDRAIYWPAYVTKRIQDTCTCYSAAILASLISMVCFYQWDDFMDFLASNSIEMLCVANVAILGSGFIVQRMPYTGHLGAKHVAMIVYAATVGAAFSTIPFLGIPVIVEAIWTTAALVVELCTVAAFTSTDFLFRALIGPVIILYTVVDIATIVGFFYTTRTSVGKRAFEINLYGGTVLFAGFILVCSHLILVVSEILKEDDPYMYDPINAGLLIFFGTTNLFVRFAILIAKEDN